MQCVKCPKNGQCKDCHAIEQEQIAREIGLVDLNRFASARNVTSRGSRANGGFLAAARSVPHTFECDSHFGEPCNCAHGVVDAAVERIVGSDDE